MKHTASDFLRSESGTIIKNHHGRISVALVYPNRYHVAMSSLGFLTVYEQLNSLDQVVCERTFVPETEGRQPADIRTLESNRPLTDFDIVAFSVSFENDYPAILDIFDLAGIPRLSRERGNFHPLVMGGGVACFLNPEPIAPFFDLFLLGEAEGILCSFFDRFDPDADRGETLLRLAREVPGVYVPSFYKPVHNSQGTLKRFEPREKVPEKVQRVFVPDLSNISTVSPVITPHTAFENTLLVEVSRGCPHGCRFCGAGFVYRPTRFRPIGLLCENLEAARNQTDRVGLMGAAVSDLPDIHAVCREAGRKNIRVSFSSLRADSLDDSLIRTLKASGVKTATIAPDAGSQRMRNVINKGIDEDHILEAAQKLVAEGIMNLKLYFMIGLPTEMDSDVEAIVDLCKKIKHRFLKSSRTRGRIGNITVSLNCFVPKPFTPFQWAAMDPPGKLKQKIKKVKAGLGKVANMRVHADVPRWAYIQGLLSRGDRRVSRLLLSAADNKGNWPKTFKESPLNSDFHVLRKRPEDELFPWDFIDQGVEKSYLLAEYRRALQAKTTPPCPTDKPCVRCGMCAQTQPV